MDFNQFGCEKRFIESIHRVVQRNVLIQEYCGDNFAFFNLVDFYYRNTSENAILMFLFILIIYPILFLCVATIADKYLANGMQDLSIRFGLSPTIAAVTLIAFANGAPDVLSSLSASGKEGGMFVALGSLYGGYIFSTCLVISNVVISYKQDIKLPKWAVLKEFFYYFMSVACVCVFALIGTAGYPFIAVYLVIYAFYIISSIYAEKLDQDSGEVVNDENELEGHLENPEENKEGSNKDELEGEDKKEEVKDEELGEGDEIKEESEKKEEDEKKGFFQLVIDELNDEEASALESLILMPLLLAGMFTVCYLENPFMKNYMKYLIISMSFFFFLYTLELTPFELWVIGLIGLGFGTLAMILELAKVSQNVLDIVYELVAVFAAIGWISIFAGIIIDFISFLAFYFSINEIILSTILLSAGNTIGDFFGNAALAKAGEPVMGTIAAYSGQIFNNFIGFSVSVLSSAAIGDTAFDVFALDYYKGEGAEEKPAPLGNYYLIAVLAFVFLIIIISVGYFSSNSFVLTKKITPILLIIYVTFFVGSMTFGILSRN